MGWAGGGEVFDPVAEKMIELGVAGNVKTEVLAVLINGLQMRGWDTEEESLGEFKNDEAIVEAFRRNKVLIRCRDENGPDGTDWCERERGDRGHADGQHADYFGRMWPVTVPGD